MVTMTCTSEHRSSVHEIPGAVWQESVDGVQQSIATRSPITLRTEGRCVIILPWMFQEIEIH